METVGKKGWSAWLKKGLMLLCLGMCLAAAPAGISAYAAQASDTVRAEAAQEAAIAEGAGEDDGSFFLLMGGMMLIILFVVAVAVSTVISCLGAGVGAGEIE